ncbi:MAG: N-acetyltransferase, partial [Acidimicrobiia bacterium]
FRLEPLGPEHNQRDHEAWMSSIDHIRATPGMGGRKWPAPMTLDENLADMEMHAAEFADRKAFTYSILDGDEVIGCVYIYPGKEPAMGADVRSWVRVSRADMDGVVRRDLTEWLDAKWPFEAISYAPGR